MVETSISLIRARHLWLDHGNTGFWLLSSQLLCQLLLVQRVVRILARIALKGSYVDPRCEFFNRLAGRRAFINLRSDLLNRRFANRRLSRWCLNWRGDNWRFSNCWESLLDNRRLKIIFIVGYNNRRLVFDRLNNCSRLLFHWWFEIFLISIVVIEHLLLLGDWSRWLSSNCLFGGGFKHVIIIIAVFK